MNFGVLLVGFGLLACPWLVASRTRSCPPGEWARVSTVAFAFGALCVYIGLVMTALPPLLHSVDLEGLLAVCDPAVHSLMIGGPFVGWTAAVLTVAVTIVGVAAARRSRRAARTARIEPWLGEHFDAGDYDLVVVPTAALLALGVPGARPQVVISEGLVAELDEARLDAVIAHEIAHHRLRHRKFLIAIAIVDRALGVVPFVRRSAQTVRESLETWADDVAVGSTTATPASLRDALVTVTNSPRRAHADTASTALMARVDRLTTGGPGPSAVTRGLTYLPVGALACGAAALVVGWVLSSQHMLALGGYC